MAKPKTMIIYAASASILALTAAAATARERGQAVRFIALEEFRGETEQNAGAVYVERREGDELVFDRIQQCYPMIVVSSFVMGEDGKGFDVDLDDHDNFAPEPAPERTKELRLQLISMGGSAPAGASDEQLEELISAQKLEQNRHPILPNAATAGTTIPDATPIMQRPDAEKLLDAGAVGTSLASVAASDDVTGGHATGAGSPTASASEAAGTAAPAADEVPLTAEQLVARHDKASLLALAKGTDATDDNNKAEIAAKIVAAREAGASS